MDKGWWDLHLTEVNEHFVGQRFSINNLPSRYKTTHLNESHFKSYGNSGAGAVSLALFGDAKKVVMLGFDCQFTGGASHWHGDHPRGLWNARQIDRWPKLFESLKNDNPEACIVNASRVTALNCFPKIPLEMALEL
jgi:hypothetical protein